MNFLTGVPALALVLLAGMVPGAIAGWGGLLFWAAMSDPWMSDWYAGGGVVLVVSGVLMQFWIRDRL